MSTEIVQAGAQAIDAPQIAQSVITIAPIAADAIVARMRAVEDIVDRLFVEDIHYGPIPGVDGSAMLYKAGAELLAATFQLALSYEVQQGDLPFGDVRFVVTCRVTHQTSGSYLGSGVGEASTLETKFAWRRAGDREWDKAPEDRRRIKEGQKRDGSTYTIKQVRQEPEDQHNTAIKMATKRAADDAIQSVLGVRGIIDQKLGEAAKPESKGRGQQAAAPKPQPVAAEWLVSLRESAKRKGIGDADLLSELERATGVSVKKLEQITAADYGYLSHELSKLVDIEEAKEPAS